MNHSSPCNHCDGKGYIELRDCSGEVQREEICYFCAGTGELIIDDEDVMLNYMIPPFQL